MEHLQYVPPAEYSSEELLRQKRHSNAELDHLLVILINLQETIASNEKYFLYN